MTYSPFEKEFDKIDEKELHKLIENEVIEGWYIEYKSQIPEKNSGNLNTQKIIKSISSFANTKGGWIFWGIECKVNSPSNICGISLENYSNLQDQLSRIISANINPTPIFHFKEVALSSGKIVFIIKVEESPMPPYITSSGTIYQRENNESNPVKDRYIIEKLNEKTQAYIKSIEEFSQTNDYGQTKGQSDSNNSFLELYLFPKPFNNFLFKDFFKSSFFESVANHFYGDVNCEIDLGDRQSIPLNIGFNSIYITNDSIIVRPLSENNLIYKGTSIELFRNGNLKLIRPLHDFGINDTPKYFENSDVIKYLWKKFVNEEEEEVEENENDDFHFSYPYINYKSQKQHNDFTNHIRFIDGGDIILFLMIIISQYEKILEENGYDMSQKIGFRARVNNTWRKFIFFDNEKYLQNIKKYNIPLIPKTDIELPKFEDGKSYNLILNEEIHPFITVAGIILNGIGLPDIMSLNYIELLINSLKRFNK